LTNRRFLTIKKGKEHEIQFRLGEIILKYAEAAFYLDKPSEAWMQ